MTTQTIKKQLTFNQAMTQFKKYVAKSDARPALKYVQYHENGYLVATNSYVLLRIHTDYITDIPKDYTVGSLINPKTLEIKQQEFGLKYPETSRLIPTDHLINIALNDNIKDIQDALKELKSIYKNSKNKVVKMELNKFYTKLSSKEHDKKTNKVLEGEITLENIHTDYDSLTISFNGGYFNNALIVAKKMNSLTGNDTELQFISHLRPFKLTQSGVFDVIVMPARIF